MISLFILMILYAYFLFLFDCCLYNIPLQTNSLKMLEQVYYSISFSYYVLSIYPAFFSVKIYIHISFRSEFKPFLAHLSWKLKWAFLIAFRPSSVCPSVCPSVCLSVCPSVCKLFLFSTSSPEPLGQFQPNLAQNILGWRGFKFVQMKNAAHRQGEIIKK